MFRFVNAIDGGTTNRKPDPPSAMDMDWDEDYDESGVVGGKNGKGTVAPGQTIASSLEFMR